LLDTKIKKMSEYGCGKFIPHQSDQSRILEIDKPKTRFDRHFHFSVEPRTKNFFDFDFEWSA